MRLPNMAQDGSKTLVQNLQHQHLNQHGAAGQWAPAPKICNVCVHAFPWLLSQFRTPLVCTALRLDAKALQFGKGSSKWREEAKRPKWQRLGHCFWRHLCDWSPLCNTCYLLTRFRVVCCSKASPPSSTGLFQLSTTLLPSRAKQLKFLVKVRLSAFGRARFKFEPKLTKRFLLLVKIVAMKGNTSEIDFGLAQLIQNHQGFSSQAFWLAPWLPFSSWSFSSQPFSSLLSSLLTMRLS